MSDESNHAAAARVRTAVSLLWLSLAVGLLVLMFDANATAANVPPALLYSIAAISALLMAFFIYQIGRGRNWARITFLVLFLLGSISFVSGLTGLFNRSVVAGTLSTAQAIMQMVALYFVFSKPGSLWFSKGAAQAAV